jgi:RNA polymerase subunit RPABC4/transcription elongation factor Spt4
MPKCLYCKNITVKENEVCYYCHWKMANYEANRRFEGMSILEFM